MPATADALPSLHSVRAVSFAATLVRFAVPPEPSFGPNPGRFASTTARTSRGVLARASAFAAVRPAVSEGSSLLTRNAQALKLLHCRVLLSPDRTKANHADTSALTGCDPALFFSGSAVAVGLPRSCVQ